MSIFLRFFLFLIVLITAGAGTPCLGQESTVLTSGEWPPYYSEKLPHGGVGAHVVQAAFALSGLDVDFAYFPWKRSFDLARAGVYAGSIGWVWMPERERDFLYSEPYLIGDIVFFHRKDVPFDWKTLDDVGDKVIGGTMSFSYVAMLKDAVRRGGGRVELVPSDTLNFRKLMEGRIDLFPCLKRVGEFLLAKEFGAEGLDRITYHPLPLRHNELHVIISRKAKDGPALIEHFNRGLYLLRLSGRYAEILQGNRDGYLPSP